MANRYYVIRTAEYGDIIKRDDDIASARQWAKTAFPGRGYPVFRHVVYPYCDDCGCSPCCCMVRADV